MIARAAIERLAAAGVASPEYDATELVVHTLGISRGELASRTLLGEIELTPEQERTFQALVARRATREPLQHLLGRTSFRYVDVEVGPGVFVPRPETELLAGWAVERCQEFRAANVEHGSSRRLFQKPAIEIGGSSLRERAAQDDHFGVRRFHRVRVVECG